jgi:hypothetical protein
MVSLLRKIQFPVSAVAVLFAMTAQVSATPGVVESGVTKVSKRYCSGTFRYAARLGNDEIFTPAPAQVFINDLRLHRVLRHTPTGEDGMPPVLARTPMCG